MRTNCSLGDGLSDLLGLGAVSESILLLSSNCFKVSASASSSSVSSDGFDGPAVSSLLIVEPTSSGGIFSVLLVEVRFSAESTDAVGMRVLFTSGRSTSRLDHNDDSV